MGPISKNRRAAWAHVKCKSDRLSWSFAAHSSKTPAPTPALAAHARCSLQRRAGCRCHTALPALTEGSGFHAVEGGRGDAKCRVVISTWNRSASH